MPELPEVQTIINDLIHAGLPGSAIQSGEVFWSKIIANISPREFTAKIAGQIITDIRRRAKYIILEFESDLRLLIHLRMSGKLYPAPASVQREKHEHVILHLSNDNDLRFYDTRKFGRMYLTENPAAILGKLGPEPLSNAFTAEQFCKMLQSKNRSLKPLLLDQQFIAGLGNIYTDEALWEARLHPQTVASGLSFKKAANLHRAIRNVLQQGIANRGTSLGTGKSNYASHGRFGNNAKNLKVFHRTGLPCPRCGAEIQRIIVAQRSTHLCPRCQILLPNKG